MILLKDILIDQQVSICKTASLEVAIDVMYNNHQGVVVVIDDNFPIGIITQKDILDIVNSSQNLTAIVTDVFKFNSIISVNSRRSIEYSINLLIDNNIKRLVVVDDSGHFLGVVTQDKLIKSLEEDSFRTNLLISGFIQNSHEIITLNQDDSIDKAFKIMQYKNIGSIIAIDENLKPIGILTQKDAVYIANSKIDKTLPIKEAMSSPIICVKSNEVVKDVINLMSAERINQILVLDDKTDEPISTLSIRDITHNLKGSYGHILENKLKNIKQTLNYIGESILEIYEDNNEQIIQWMNDKAIENFGKCLDKSIFTIFDAKSWFKIYKQIKDYENCERFKIESNGMYFEVICSYHLVNDKETILLILKDISEFEYAVIDANKKSIELEKELNILQGVIDQQNNIVMVTNGRTIVSTNKSFFNFFNVVDVQQFTNKYGCLSDTFITHDDFYSLADGINWIEDILERNEKDRVVSIIESKTIEPKVFTIQLNKLSSDNENYVVTFTDITEIKLQSQKYYFNATHDALTQIYNRAYYLDAIKIALDKVKRYQSTFSVILLDIDHFKKFNDNYGHIKGDEILVSISSNINKNVRISDVFARWGGEEFIVLLPETALEKAELLAQNLRKIISNIDIEGVDKITASFGVTQFHEYDNENTITQRADEAMYEAKESGRNKVISK